MQNASSALHPTVGYLEELDKIPTIRNGYSSSQGERDSRLDRSPLNENIRFSSFYLQRGTKDLL